MKKFETNEANDCGYIIIFVNPQNVETIEEASLNTFAKIRMVSGKEHIVRGNSDQVAARLMS